jgi:hypothetical protein
MGGIEMEEYMNTRKYLLSGVLFCALSLIPLCNLHSEYSSAEFAFIEWGDQPHQLEIGMPNWVDVNDTPDDSTDDLMEGPPGGPTQVIIDQYENIYVSSYDLNYLKAFNSSGHLILDFSFGTSAYDNLLNGARISKFYVDSLSRIFLLMFPPNESVILIDTLGNLLNEINPLGPGSDIDVCEMFINSNDVISVCLCNGNLYTYEGGNFTPGGAMGKLAIDGHYYNAGLEDSTLIRLIRYSNPGIDGYGSELQETFIPFFPYFLSCGLLGVDNNTRLFLSIFDYDSNSRIRIYSTSYELLNEIVFPPASNKYSRFTGSHLRNDGTIYELRYLDDGLSIIKWTER